ncbi:hypothetical protein CEXT_287721 [Caerostris extrusa]|uniref:Uncharacterized protein n=1 Tax=Caerostris extrusa TaxID=172846 RepID=A0AAV4S709_CAEEX|nr:hypothetical protein CEXT_287721 [Caerostris extrusa]
MKVFIVLLMVAVTFAFEIREQPCPTNKTWGDFGDCPPSYVLPDTSCWEIEIPLPIASNQRTAHKPRILYLKQYEESLKAY